MSSVVFPSNWLPVLIVVKKVSTCLICEPVGLSALRSGRVNAADRRPRPI